MALASSVEGRRVKTDPERRMGNLSAHLLCLAMRRSPFTKESWEESRVRRKCFSHKNLSMEWNRG